MEDEDKATSVILRKDYAKSILKQLESYYEVDGSMLLRSDIDALKASINPNYFKSGHKDFGKI